MPLCCTLSKGMQQRLISALMEWECCMCDFCISGCPHNEFQSVLCMACYKSKLVDLCRRFMIETYRALGSLGKEKHKRKFDRGQRPLSILNCHYREIRNQSLHHFIPVSSKCLQQNLQGISYRETIPFENVLLSS